MLKSDNCSVRVDGSTETLLGDYIAITLAMRDILPDIYLLTAVKKCLSIDKELLPKIKIDIGKIKEETAK